MTTKQTVLLFIFSVHAFGEQNAAAARTHPTKPKRVAIIGWPVACRSAKWKKVKRREPANIIGNWSHNQSGLQQRSIWRDSYAFAVRKSKLLL